MFNPLDTNEDKAIKKIFSHLTGWKYTCKWDNGIVYWEVNFPKGIDLSIDKDLLRKRIYDLQFEPASSMGRGTVADFYGVYKSKSLRKKFNLAEFKEAA